MSLYILVLLYSNFSDIKNLWDTFKTGVSSDLSRLCLILQILLMFVGIFLKQQNHVVTKNLIIIGPAVFALFQLQKYISDVSVSSF